MIICFAHPTGKPQWFFFWQNFSAYKSWDFNLFCSFHTQHLACTMSSIDVYWMSFLKVIYPQRSICTCIFFLRDYDINKCTLIYHYSLWPWNVMSTPQSIHGRQCVVLQRKVESEPGDQRTPSICYCLLSAVQCYIQFSQHCRALSFFQDWENQDKLCKAS